LFLGRGNLTAAKRGERESLAGRNVNCVCVH
jgi:hypothetical protein